MSARGFLVPERYVPEIPSETDMNIASIFWGLSLGIAIYCAIQAGRQSRRSWKRRDAISPYVMMIWAEWIVSITIGAVAWCFQRQFLAPSFQLFLIVACLWSAQIQLLMQIIINRIGIMMVLPSTVSKLKWSVFLLLLLVNISVLVIWIPARLQISEKWIHVNDIWDRAEKVIFGIVDLSLNLLFVYLVRYHLVKNGLSKYIPLYRFNLLMMCFSLSLDVVLIGLMSLPSTLVYLQFHPVAYLLKLSIEMNMAELIIKVSRAPSAGDTLELYQLAPQTLASTTSGDISGEISTVNLAPKDGDKTEETASTISLPERVQGLEDIATRKHHIRGTYSVPHYNPT